MKHYYDIHDQGRVEMVVTCGDNSATPFSDTSLQALFNSADVRKLTLSQYRRMAVQYSGS